MTTLERVVPVFPVRNVRAALEHYRRLGFVVEAYAVESEGDPIYGFIRRGPIELHLARTTELEPNHNTSACYLYVDDANGLLEEWSRAGAGGRLHEPVDTDYGLREFAHVDPDGNLLRVGSPMKRA
jgi:catechol 2,3-dioxygenase-like lactoylglutathione lyase family enzyme